MHNNYLRDALKRIKMCTSYEMFFNLEEDLNNVGLTIQTTNQSRMILCRIENNKPIANKVTDDYIFVGGIQDQGKEMSQRMVECIVNFVIENSGEQSKVEDSLRDWQKMAATYGNEPINLSAVYHGKSVQIEDEDVSAIAQDIEIPNAREKTEKEIIDEIAKFLDSK